MLDDASSFLSDRDSSAPAVSSVRRLRRIPGFSRIVLDDESWFPLTTRTTENLGIVPGFFFAPHELEQLQAEGWRAYAYALGLDLLGRTETPAFGLRRKLIQRKVPVSAVDHAIDALQAEGSLDDRRFADSWLRVQLRSKSVSRRALLAGLRRRGVAREIAEAAVTTAFEEEPELHEKLFRRAVDQVMSRRNMNLDKAARALLRRGFRTEQVARWYQSEQSKLSE